MPPRDERPALWAKDALARLAEDSGTLGRTVLKERLQELHARVEAEEKCVP